MLSLWMLDDALALDAQTAPHGSSDPSSTDAFRREKSCRDVLVNAQDPGSVNPTSRRSLGSSRLSRKSRKRERSRPWILDLGSWILDLGGMDTTCLRWYVVLMFVPLQASEVQDPRSKILNPSSEAHSRLWRRRISLRIPKDFQDPKSTVRKPRRASLLTKPS